LKPHLNPVVALSLTAFATTANIRIIENFLAEIAAEFDTTVGAASSVLFAFTLAYGLMQFVAGPASDRFGRLKVVTAATTLSAVVCLLCAAATDLTSLVGARVLAGAIAGGIFPVAMAYIGDTVALERRQQVIAQFMLGHIMGLTLGQTAGGIIGEFLGWRTVFVVLSVAFFVCTGLLMLLPRAMATPGRTAAVSAYASFAVFKVFLSNPVVRRVLSLAFLEACVVFAALAFVSPDLRGRLGIGAGVSGMVLGGFGLGGLFYVLFVGRLAVMPGRSRLVAAGGLVFCLGIAPLGWIGAVATAMICLVVGGFGFYAVHTTLQTEATQMHPQARGLAMGAFAATLFFGQSVGVAAAGVIFDCAGAVPIYLTAAAIFLCVAFVTARSVNASAPHAS